MQAQAAQAFRNGQHEKARALFSSARDILEKSLGPDDAKTLTALSDYGAACAALGDFEAARAAHEWALAGRRRALGTAHPEIGASLHNLGTVLRAQGDAEAAEQCHLEGLKIWRAALGEAHPVIAKSLAALGLLARERGDAPASIAYARQVLAIRTKILAATDPQIAAAWDDLATAHAMAGQDREAAEAWQSALAILRQTLGPTHRRLAPVLNNLGVICRAARDFTGAKTWFAAAVAADPNLADARHNLAAALARLGEAEEASRQRTLALRQKSLFFQKATKAAKAELLIFSLSDAGNVPLEHILPEQEFTRIWYFVGQAEAPKTLPRHDIAFNGIGDPDMLGDAERNLIELAQLSGRKLLNPPDRIAHTRRDLLPATLAGIDGLLVPAVCRISGTPTREHIWQTPQTGGLTPPFLLRPAGSHGGADLKLFQSLDGLDPILPQDAPAWYLTEFIDSRGPDGFYRKYRMAFVDRRPLPYHLAISKNWLVHYFSADMQAHEWKLAEEAAFLAEPRKALGPRAYAAIEAAARKLDLDFCGIDFTLLPDGRALVFEANATMLIHPESETGKLAFKNPYVRTIITAVSAMIEGRIEVLS